MQQVSGLMNLANNLLGRRDTAVANRLSQVEEFSALLDTPAPPADHYHLLLAYYLGDALYERIARNLYDEGLGFPPVKPVRNPAYRTVEFFVSYLWPGQIDDALQLEKSREKIRAPLQQVWKWSQWEVKKQLAARWFALFGDLFIKVIADPERKQVYFQLINPIFVTDFTTDHRGFLTMLRMDFPQERRVNKATERFVIIEVWDKNLQTVTFWNVKRSPEHLDELEDDPEAIRTVYPMAAMGIDFIPVAHGKFKDVGDQRGLSSFAAILDKIDEVNRIATRLHQMFFRYGKPQFYLKSNDSLGTIPRIQVPGYNVDQATDDGSMQTMELGDESFLSLPGNTDLGQLVPQVDLHAALRVIEAMDEELEKDAPVLAFHRIHDLGEVSARSVRVMMSDAVDQVKEARGNLYSVFIRADEMALHMGQYHEFPLFTGLGVYEDGDFEHALTEDDVIEPTGYEEHEARRMAVEVAQRQALVPGISREQILLELGYTEDQQREMEAQLEEQRQEDEKRLAEQQATLGNQAGEGTQPFQSSNNRENETPGSPAVTRRDTNT